MLRIFPVYQMAIPEAKTNNRRTIDEQELVKL